MSPKPLVTVLMSIRNAMPYLPESVTSILEQHFKDFEFIIVDDHSTDGSFDYLKSLLDPRIKLLISPDQGQTKALNLGLAAAQGRWVARMDGDDWSHPDRLMKQLASAEAIPGAVLVSANYWLCNESLKPISEMNLNTNSPGFLKYLMHRQNPFCHPVMMFDRVVVRNFGGYDERLTTAQDYALWRLLLTNGKLAHAVDPLLKYRVRRGAVSIARYNEQSTSHKHILNPEAVQRPQSSVDPEGLYAYRLGFAAWIGGESATCIRFMSKAIAHRVRVKEALAAIFLSLLPRRLYLRLTGFAHVYQ